MIILILFILILTKNPHFISRHFQKLQSYHTEILLLCFFSKIIQIEMKDDPNILKIVQSLQIDLISIFKFGFLYYLIKNYVFLKNYSFAKKLLKKYPFLRKIFSSKKKYLKKKH